MATGGGQDCIELDRAKYMKTPEKQTGNVPSEESESGPGMQ